MEVSVRIRTTVTAILMCSCLWATSAMAQTAHVADVSTMRQAIANQAVIDQQNREAVLGVLSHSQARDVASRLGLSLTDAERAVSTLSGAELAGLAGTARMADLQLAGGYNTIVISMTSLLLIIIIIILLA